MLGLIKSAEKFVGDGRYITFNNINIEKISKKLCDEKTFISGPTWNSKAFIQSDSFEDICQYFFVGNSINFRFWRENCGDRYKYGEFSGSEAMWSCLTHHPQLMNANYLEQISLEEVKGIFQDIPMIHQRWIALREIAKVLNTKYKGKVLNLLKDNNFDAELIVSAILRDFPEWNDCQEGMVFAKRAQLFIAMVYGRTKSSQPLLLKNLESMTLFADYQLPKVLQILGVLNYSPVLKNWIQNEVIIEKGSRAELELRAFTIIAGERIRKNLEIIGLKKTSVEIDACLWFLARSYSGKHHLTETTYY